jgi:hypothetical protein
MQLSITSIILFIYRLFKHLGILLFICIPLEVIGWFILLPVCYFKGTNIAPLPTYLKWFDNADQYVGRDTSTYEQVVKSDWFNRYVWLAYRNPINAFG